MEGTLYPMGVLDKDYQEHTSSPMKLGLLTGCNERECTPGEAMECLNKGVKMDLL